MRRLFLMGCACAASIVWGVGEASFAPDGIPFGVAAKSWAVDGWGNHRALVRVPQAGPLARATLPWRRVDPQPEIKKVRVVSASGVEVTNVVASVSAEMGVIDFEPVAGEGAYYIYYLPYRERHGSHEGRGQPWWNDYFKADYTVGTTWRATLKNATPVACEPVSFESRSSFEAWTPMGLRATQAEMDAIRRAHPENPIVFTEDRTNPIHPAAWLPAKWARAATFGRFAGTALRDEYYVWQLALWTPGGAVQEARLEFSDLTSETGARIDSEALTCINTDGVNWDGHEFHQAVNVPANRLQPLWCGVMIPRTAEPGLYRGQVKVIAGGAVAQMVALEITVADQVVRDHGDSELWRMSRLRWLNSRLGEGDTPVEPYQPLACDKATRQITATDKVVTLGGNGLPTSIKVATHEVLKAPIKFVVETDKEITEFSGESLALMPKTPGDVRWFAQAQKQGLTFRLNAHMEFDGFIRYFIDVQAAKEMHVKDVRLETPYTPEASEYLMGIGYRGRDGGFSPKAYTWNWKGPYDSYWMGGPEAGLHVEFRGGTYHGPLIADVSYHPAPPPTWANGGKGTVTVGGENGLTVVAHTGETTLSSQTRTWAFDLLLTPVKPVDVKKQFSQRYYHAAPEGFPAAAERGANIANIHHAQSLNPVINYPFVVQEPLKKYIDEQHAHGRKVKLYYTIRELSNHVAELQALRSLGNEVIAAGNAHGAPWLWEHMGEGYRPAWYVRLKDRGVKVGDEGLVDAAFVLSPHSRWINYYLEGLRWMFENYRIDGIYMDDVSFDRTVMKRMRRIIEQYRPGALVDLHSNTGYSRGPANQYTDFFPYVDRLWFGESFQYNAMSPDTWFVTFSGIPFGQMGEMLQNGGNPWLGTVYGTSRRYYGAVTENNPTAIWKAWSDFGIAEAKMAGYWEKQPAVSTDSPDVKATAFIRPGKTLIAVGNFATQARSVKLTIDWARLGLDPAKVRIEAPAIPDFQAARTFARDEAIPIEPKCGWLLLLSAVSETGEREN